MNSLSFSSWTSSGMAAELALLVLSCVLCAFPAVVARREAEAGANLSAVVVELEDEHEAAEDEKERRVWEVGHALALAARLAAPLPPCLPSAKSACASVVVVKVAIVFFFLCVVRQHRFAFCYP